MMDDDKRITDESVHHHWSHCAYVFCLSGLATRVIKIAILQGLVSPTPAIVFAYVSLAVALGYWLLWVLNELNEIIPRENHRRLLMRRRFDWGVLWEKTNFFELTYRLMVAISIIVGFSLGGID
jgi:hypothetical protein